MKTEHEAKLLKVTKSMIQIKSKWFQAKYMIHLNST